MKRLLLLAVVAAAVAAPAAHATNECRGLMICVPVAGPWVLTSPAAHVEYDLVCPKGYIVAGLDAELSVRGIDVGFVGGLGSPVNPGITTQRDAVFRGRLVRGSAPAPSFRPHVGCVPASGGGQRVPTAAHVFPPAKPTARTVTQVPATRNRFATARCAKAERLVSATYAIGFYGTPPTAAQAQGIHVTQRVRNGVATYSITSHVKAVVQLDLVCVPR